MGKTGCECPLAGYCSRHGMTKTDHYHKLCQNHEKYFQMWEGCRGPGQDPGSCGEKEPPKEENIGREPETQTPKICELCNDEGCNGKCREPLTKWEMAKSFGAAMVDHVKDGFKKTEQTEQERRLEICAGCDHYNKERHICSICKCPLNFKSRLASAHCPISKWMVLFPLFFQLF